MPKEGRIVVSSELRSAQRIQAHPREPARDMVTYLELSRLRVRVGCSAKLGGSSPPRVDFAPLLARGQNLLGCTGQTLLQEIQHFLVFARICVLLDTTYDRTRAEISHPSAA